MGSLWIDSVKNIKNDYKSLDEDIVVDVCVVGGGITGISTAYMLAKSGLKVCVLEKNVVGHHTTRKYYSVRLPLGMVFFMIILLRLFLKILQEGI